MKESERLKRLAAKYAKACVDLSWLGNTEPEVHDKTREAHKRAKKALYNAIDEVTNPQVRS